MKFDGKRLRDLREAKGLTQDQLAKKVKVNRVSVSQWETGEHEPSLPTIGKIGEALDVKGTFFISEE